jgi:hypothetical protein
MLVSDCIVNNNFVLIMKKSKPPSIQRRLRPQIKTIMTKLTKHNLRSHNNCISLYNDFLILSVVA